MALSSDCRDAVPLATVELWFMGPPTAVTTSKGIANSDVVNPGCLVRFGMSALS